MEANKPGKSRWRLLFILWIASGLSQTVVADPDVREWGVGFERIELADPMGGKMQASVWYPTEKESGTIGLGPFKFPGTWNAEPAKEITGWVVVSHGTGGSDLGHRNLAVALAQAGIIAIAPLYPRNNFRDNSGLGQRVVWEGRPLQLNALITYMRTEGFLRSQLENIPLGLFGFSLGGYTVISLLTGGHDLQRFISHCEQNIASDPVCRFDGRNMVAAMKSVYQQEYQVPLLTLTPPDVCASLLADPMMAPVSDVLLAKYPDIPTLMYLPTIENQVSAEHNGKRFQQLDALSGRSNKVVFRVIKNAQHFSFLAPFPPALAAELPELTNDHPEFDRVEFQERFASEVTDFFDAKFSSCRQ